MAMAALARDPQAEAGNRRPASDGRRAARRVIAAAILTRAVVAATAWAGTHFPRDGKFQAVAADGHRYVYSPWRILDGLARWDSAFYLRIAAQGYRATGDAPYDAAFFPLYPALVRGVAGITGLPLAAAGVLVSLACFALAVRAVFLLFEQLAGPERAAGATVALLAFPASLFLSAVYTESLFLLVTATALLAARRRQFTVAAIASALATLTRPNGALVIVAVLVEGVLALRSGERRLRTALGIALVAALPAAALGLHAWHLGQVYRDPLAFAHVQAVWGRGFAPPWRALLAFAFDPDYYVVALGWLAAIAWAVRRQPVSFQLYAALSLVVPLCSGTLKSLPRFAGVTFPLFLTVDAWTTGRRARVAYLAVAISLLAVYAFRFARYDAVN